MFLKRFFILSIFLTILGLGFFLVGQEAFAQVDPDPFGTKQVDDGLILSDQSIWVTVTKIINVILGLLGLIAVGIVLYAGYLIMTSGGNEETIGRAKKMLFNGIIGLIIILSSFTIAQFVLNALTDATGVPLGEMDCALPENQGELKCICKADPTDPLCLADTCKANPFLSMCTDKEFYVKSITPSTPSGQTGMNNIVVRALFSQPLDSDTDPKTALTLKSGATDIPLKSALIEGNRIIKAEYDTTQACVSDIVSGLPWKQPLVGVLPNLQNGYVFSSPGDIKKLDDGPTNTILDLPKPFTAKLRFKLNEIPPKAKGKYGFMMAKSASYFWGIETATGKFCLQVAEKPGGAGAPIGTVTCTNESLAVGVIHDVVATYDGTTVKIFAGGVPSTGSMNTILSNDLPLFVGGEQFNPPLFLKWTLFEYKILEGKAVNTTEVQQLFALAKDPSSVAQTCLASGAYTVAVNEEVKSSKGEKVKKNFSFGNFSFPLSANFTVGSEFIIDQVPPLIESIQINGKPASGQSLPIGENFTLTAVVKDKVPPTAPFGGVGYVHLKIVEKGTGSIKRQFWDGPKVLDGSSNTFTFSVTDVFSGAKYSAGKQYDITVTAYDIDHNSTVVTVTVGAIAGHCNNGVKDANETGIDVGGSCGGGGGSSCASNADCAVGFSCQNNSCTAWPTITNIDPLNGAAENWVTIQGYHFGGTTGTVQFLYDKDGDGNEDIGEVWVSVNLAQCGEDVWHDDWVIAEVPNDLILPQDKKAVIRIIPKGQSPETPELFDTSMDSNGPQIGFFTKNSIKRPKLCTVQTTEGKLTAAPIATPVIATGQAFGDTQENDSGITFGGVESGVPSGQWSNSSIPTVVPSLDLAGKTKLTVGVVVTAKGEKSNGVPFTVLASASTASPIISAIDPAKTTKGSYVTMSGQGFGNNKGKVYMALSTVQAKNCAQETNPNPALCIELLTDLGNQCQSSWQDTQVVVEVPLIDAVEVNKKYFVILKNSIGYASSGDDILEIKAGGPEPSICSISPAGGVAPILDANAPLTIAGKNFKPGEGAANPTVYFWKSGAKAPVVDDLTYLDTWLSTVNPFILPGVNTPQAVMDAFKSQWSDIMLKTLLPVNGDGYTMLRGPIKVKNSSGGVSNSFTYNAIDCAFTPTAQKTKLQTQYECCTEGPDAGQWKVLGQGCTDVSREAGYVWRFTSGKIPIEPEVVKECNVQDWLNWKKFPSPTPSTDWPQGVQACINATVAVRFTTDMDEPTVLETENVKVYQCGKGESADCGAGTEVATALSYDGDEKVLKIIEGTKNPLVSNTWYRVVLKGGNNGIKAAPFEVSQGKTEQLSLKSTRPCDAPAGGGAYCYEFKTGDNTTCELVKTYIAPSQWTVSYLGIILKAYYQNKNEHKGKTTPAELSSEVILFYNLFGKTDHVCSMMEVQGMGWKWGTTDNDKASTFSTPPADDKAAVVAKEETVDPSTVDIIASTTQNISGVAKTWIADPSPLKIDLSVPGVTYFEPNCAEACLNGGILVEFSLPMLVNTYQNGFKVEKCTDANCLAPAPFEGYSIDPASDSFTLRAVLNANSSLEKNTYYKVTLNGTAAVEGGIKVQVTLGDEKKPGKSLPGTSWVFKTQNSDTACTVSTVTVVPSPFTATAAGQKTLYTVLPKAAPSECSKYGQTLNKWQYGYEWSTEKPDVATVTNFSTPNYWKPTCTIGCVPKGSTIPWSPGSKSYPVCGNGIVDPGEDCDTAAAGETVGQSCTFSCLRPGNTDKQTCGDGQVQTSLGELCDPGVAGHDGLCTDKCLPAGSSQIFNTNKAGFCGDAKIGIDESCDTPGKNGCSTTCLNTGTSVLSAWCESSEFANNLACKTSISICGNDQIEEGEECERGGDNDTSILIEKNGEQVSVGVEKAADHCTAACLLKDICDISEIPLVSTGGLRCQNDTDEGCVTGCTLAGSSPLYTTSSLCGDGVIGIGEYGMCEVPAAPVGNNQNAVQIVTAIGNGEVKNINGKQEQTTYVNATLVTSTIKKIGQGEYALSCGFVEYKEKTADVYNDCPNNADNNTGVGSNSCCYPRPKRTESSPIDGAGYETEPTCRNTLLSVTLNKEMKKESLLEPGNILLASGHPTGYSCASGGEETVTDIVNSAVAFGPTVGKSPEGFWSKFWFSIKQFFVRLVGKEVHAVGADVWCTGKIVLKPEIAYVQKNNATSTIGIIGINQLLDANTEYRLILRGGPDGIVDLGGVGIKNPAKANRDDIISFQTGSDICKVASVTVEPPAYTFTSPLSTASFLAKIHSTNGQLIQSIPGVYAWDLSWHPKNNPVFAIPAPGTTPTGNSISIAAKNVEGHITGFASIKIGADTSSENNQLGKTFVGSAELYAEFCANPWPDTQTSPYEDGMPPGQTVNNDGVDSPYSNFSMKYCADAGKGETTADDLPFLEPVVFTQAQTDVKVCAYDKKSCTVATDCDYYYYTPGSGLGLKVQKWTDNSNCSNDGSKKCSSNADCGGALCNKSLAPLGPNINTCQSATDALKKFLFFNTKNADVIGIQIFKNPMRLSASQWFKEKFPDAPTPQNIVLDGYDGVTTGNNYYINALNIDATDKAYNNIYLFSLSEGAQQNTKEVFQQLLDSLTFNINVSDAGYCGADIKTPNFDISKQCTNDIDCGTAVKENTSQEEVYGICTVQTEGDSKWEKVVLPTSEDLNSAVLVGTKGWVVGSLDVPLFTSDEGKTWVKQTTPDPVLSTTIFHDVEFINENEGWAVGRFNTILHTITAGQTWELQTAILQNPTLHGVSFVNATYGWAVGYNGTILLTKNGGKTWTPQTSNTTKSLKEVDFVTAAKGWAVGDAGTYLQTINGGITWTVKSSGVTTDLRDVYFLDDKKGWIVGAAGTILSTVDGGAHWIKSKNFENLSEAKLSEYGLNAIFFTDAMHGWIVGEKGALLQTNDGGKTWNFVILESTDHTLNSIFMKDATHGWIVGNKGVAFRLGYATTCTSNTDCTTPNICVGYTPKKSEFISASICTNEKTKLKRDWIRLQHLRLAQTSIDSYFQDNKGKLGTDEFKASFKGGSYLPYYTVSKWPSWGNLGSLVGGLPSDPINEWSTCPEADAQTCWKAASSTYYCPAVASVYEYSFATATLQYQVHFPFEYFSEITVKKDFSSFVPNQTSFTTTRWCTPNQQYAIGSGSCGDGVVNIGKGEECDPPNSKKIVSCGGGIQTFTCTDSCLWDGAAACASNSVCGNGKVELGETCDDGVFNGLYGHCNAPDPSAAVGSDAYLGCRSFGKAGFCGNAVKDPEEFCDATADTTLKKYSENKEATCSWDCQTYGGYCGDGKLHNTDGEVCDDANTAIGDGCSFCKQDNFICKNTNPYITTSTQYTYVYLKKGTILNTNPVTIQGSIPAECSAGTTPTQICAGYGLPCSGYQTIPFPGQGYKTTQGCGYNLSSLEGKTTNARIECTGIYTGKIIDKPDSTGGPVCGNTVVEEGEACDLGAENGKSCTPSYGKSCTYCAADCKAVLTKDAQNYCGDGKITDAEYCDVKADGTVLGLDTQKQTKDFMCSQKGPYAKGTYSCDPTCMTGPVDQCVVCGTKPSGPEVKLAIINPMVGNQKIGFDIGQWLSSITTDIGMFDAQSAFEPLWENYTGIFDSSYTKQVLIEGLAGGIESSPLCSDDYAVVFNKNEGGKTTKLIKKDINANQIFSYPLLKKAGVIENEYILSPAVPQKTFRVVLRWTGLDGDNNFVAGIYNKVPYTIQGGSKLDTTLTHTYAQAKGAICSSVVNNTNKYLVPADACKGFTTSAKEVIFFHPYGQLETLRERAITIDTVVNHGDKVAFFVEDTLGPMLKHVKNGSLVVEVYEFQSGQTSSSVFKPKHSFSITDTQGTSSNESAQYWYVFNLVNEGTKTNPKYVVKPVQKIRTGTEQLQEEYNL